MSCAKLILAVDQGTTNTKALLMDGVGAVKARASRPLSISFPRPGWVEQDARALWASVLEAAGDCIEQAGGELAVIGISNQRESALVWDRRTGDPVGPCIVWQCRRTSEFCDELRMRGAEDCIRKRCGLPIDPLFSASKIRWLLANTPDGFARAAAGELCAGTVDSWLLWNLTGGAVHATDASNASRTQLLSLAECSWDTELLQLFEIPAACLPAVQPSSHHMGMTASSAGALPAGVPIGSLIGDSHAALFGHAAFSPGAVKATYGTGSSLMSPIERPAESLRGLSTTVAWAACGSVRYALEGNITNTGGAVQWLGEFLGLAGGSEEVAALADSVADSGGSYLVPAFAGLGAPHWDSGARGVLCGLTRGTSAAHVARATVDSIGYQVYDVFDAMRQDAGIPLPALFADGGASRNDRLMQFQADLVGCPVVRSSSTELSAIGAAWLAGLAVGCWNSLDELEALPHATTRFEPQIPDSQRAALINGWHEALKRTRSAV